MGEDANRLVKQLETTKQYFEKTASCLDEADSGFAPKPEMMTVAQQVAHAAQTVDWFLEGAFTKEKFNHDFAAMGKEIKAVTSLKAAREWMTKSFSRFIDEVKNKSDAELAKPLADPSIMGPIPRGAIIGGLVDHTAHHRGTLTVYARLLGKTPAMPYM